MSDIVLGPGKSERQEHEGRRAAASMAAALVLHAAAILVVALIVAANPGPMPLPPLSVSLLAASSPSDQPAASPASSAPVAPLSAPVSGKAQPTEGSGAGFVIPTPRAQTGGSSTAGPTGPGFRQAGGTTGGAESLPAVQSPVPGATLPAAQSGSGSGTGTGSTQHAGQGVAVTDPSAGTTRGSLDLSGLDKAMTGPTAPGSGTARAGAGSTTSGAGGGAAGIVGPDYRVVWDRPEVSKGREVVRADTPKIPSWVGKQGLTLSVTVSFTLGAEGVLTGVSLEKSSGYADVDSAVMEAIRRWRFTSSRGASPIKGLIPYRITSH